MTKKPAQKPARRKLTFARRRVLAREKLKDMLWALLVDVYGIWCGGALELPRDFEVVRTQLLLAREPFNEIVDALVAVKADGVKQAAKDPEKMKAFLTILSEKLPKFGSGLALGLSGRDPFGGPVH